MTASCDGMGQAVDFKNTIIIATSNAGAEYIKRSGGERRLLEW